MVSARIWRQPRCQEEIPCRASCRRVGASGTGHPTGGGFEPDLLRSATLDSHGEPHEEEQRVVGGAEEGMPASIATFKSKSG